MTDTPATPQTTSPDDIQRRLRDLAHQVVSSCPDTRQMARQVALQLLDAQGIGQLDPDAIWWHRFSEAASSPHAFTGWSHVGPPTQSLTLVQLVMRRFPVRTQEGADNLTTMSGFYTAPSSAETFDETNEVRLLPPDVLARFWQIDFKNRMIEALGTFWSEHGEHYRDLAKVNFIAKLLEERQNGQLGDNHLSELLDAVAGGIRAPITLETLRQRCPAPAGTRVYFLRIGSYQSSNILRIASDNGRQYLYVPGTLDPLHAFASMQDLHWWLLMQNNHAQNRAQFMTHFALSTHDSDDQSSGLNHTIDLLYSTWGRGDHSLIDDSQGQPLRQDIFSALGDSMKQRMFADANRALRSNGELRKQIWIGYLGAFNKVFGPMAALDWPVGLAVVGAGLADMGLNIDQAVNGTTTAEREAGTVGAITAGIGVLFDGACLWGSWASAMQTEDIVAPAVTPPVEPGSPALSLPALTPGRSYPATLDELLEPFKSNALLGGYTPASDGHLRGVYITPGGNYIEIGGDAYAVRYVNELTQWVIVDPDNPYAFYRNVPVRLNSAGQWEITPRPSLSGGGKVLGKMPWGCSPKGMDNTAQVATPYDMPQAVSGPLLEAAEDPSSRLLQGYVDLDVTQEGADPVAVFEQIRDDLVADAQAFQANTTLPARPVVPALASAPTPKQLIEQLFSERDGVVLGEAHSDAGSKRFLIDNMPRLAKANVRTLYMEHLMTDFHQADLDVFARTGKMPQPLARYLNLLDEGHATDPTGRYTFLSVVKAANANHVRIRAIDCLASYRLTGVDNPSSNLRQQLMNFFAHEVIVADQPGRAGSRWVALVGNSHANRFLGVPGLAEREGVMGVRVVDVPPGTAAGLDVDPGLPLPAEGTRPALVLKSDLRLRVEVAGARLSSSATPVRTLLKEPGDYLIKVQGVHSQLIHRSREGAIVTTAILFDNGHPYVIRSGWPSVNRRRFDDFAELITALNLMGMRQMH